jgi:hypothetical protein
MTWNRSLRAATVTAVAGLAGVAFSAPAMAAPGAGSTAQSTAVQTTAGRPPAPKDLRVDEITATSVRFRSDNPPLEVGNCTLDAYLYYTYVNGAYYGAGYPGSPVGYVTGRKPHTTYRLQLQRRNICTNAESDLSAPLIVTTLG